MEWCFLNATLPYEWDLVRFECNFEWNVAF